MPEETQIMPPNESIKAESFHDRVAKIVRLCGTVSAAAKAAGVSESVVRKWKNGASEPSTSHLVALARAGNVSIEWLATGEDAVPAQSSPGDEYAMVPFYDVHTFSSHNAAKVKNPLTNSLALKRQWIHQELHVEPTDLYLVYVNDDAMAPTFRSGDIILIDRRNAQAVPHDGIYALRMNDCLLIKRLQRFPNHKVKVSSDNPAYAAFELDIETLDDDLAIIGRVIWSGRRM